MEPLNLTFNNCSIEYSLLIYNPKTKAWESNSNMKNLELVNSLIDNHLNDVVIDLLNDRCDRLKEFKEDDVLSVWVDLELIVQDDAVLFQRDRLIDVTVNFKNTETQMSYEIYYNSYQLNKTLATIRDFQLATI